MARQVANTRRAISPRLATSTLLITVAPLMPEYAELRTVAGADQRQAHAQHRPGVAWVDHAVVVQPAGEEQCRGLLLDLVLHHEPHRAVLLLVVGVPLGLGRLPGHDRQHAGQLLR